MITFSTYFLSLPYIIPLRRLQQPPQLPRHQLPPAVRIIWPQPHPFPRILLYFYSPTPAIYPAAANCPTPSP